jgi:HSP20 family protein
MTDTEIVPKPTQDPWTDLENVFDELRNRFFAPFGTFSLPRVATLSAFPLATRVPRTDIQETEDAYKIVAEIPGIPKERLEISVKGANVEIRAENETTSESKGQAYVHRERSYHGFFRSFELPEPVIGSDAQAKLENGVLELTLPKQAPKPTAKEVKVKVK